MTSLTRRHSSGPASTSPAATSIPPPPPPVFVSSSTGSPVSIFLFPGFDSLSIETIIHKYGGQVVRAPTATLPSSAALTSHNPHTLECITNAWIWLLQQPSDSVIVCMRRDQAELIEKLIQTWREEETREWADRSERGLSHRIQSIKIYDAQWVYDSKRRQQMQTKQPYLIQIDTETQETHNTAAVPTTPSPRPPSVSLSSIRSSVSSPLSSQSSSSSSSYSSALFSGSPPNILGKRRVSTSALPLPIASSSSIRSEEERDSHDNEAIDTSSNKRGKRAKLPASLFPSSVLPPAVPHTTVSAS